MVSSPRALIIKHSSNDNELKLQPLWIVIIGEFLFRLGIFFVVAASFEELIGDDQFEHLNSDLFLGALILSGVFHTAIYIICFHFIVRRSIEIAESAYRFGRNICYSILPAFPVAAGFIIYQDMKKIIYENPQTIEIAFLSTWVFFILLGIAEWALIKRKPLGLGAEFELSLKS